MRVLIADDDPLALRMLEHAVAKFGYEVDAVDNGEDALAVLRAGRTRLVISDWEMPGLSGVELCKAVREQDFSGYVYVILLSARDGSTNIVEGLAAGADDFMSKPFNPAELSMRIRVGERVLSLETRDVAIFALAKLAESRDPETGAHLERVQNYCRVLSEYLLTRPEFREQVNREYVRLIYATSPLHDIGKVAIPDCVLLKPGRFTDREFEIMKTHTLHGAATLEAAMAQNPNARFLKIARDIALTHHEQFDGKGYPHGLAGEAIPLCGRIVALADVYDAMVSKRVYKEAFDHDVARAAILDGKESHFDPRLVEAFVKNEQQFIKIKDHYRDGGHGLLPDLSSPAASAPPPARAA